MTHTTDINRSHFPTWGKTPEIEYPEFLRRKASVARLAIAIWPDASRDLIVAAQANKNLQDAGQHDATHAAE